MAPEIAEPFEFHWYASVTPAPHEPGTAVSVLPTVAEPEMVGVGVVDRVPAPMVEPEEVCVTELACGADPVTETVIELPRSPGCTA